LEDAIIADADFLSLTAVASMLAIVFILTRPKSD